uniref:Probable L-gulonolactone oxidase 6 n=1 Tax=Tanacetum cinerariifolium TaxID=118510 RepID=A0A6L2KFS9_TANCI|nr:probable L-gulonolactone oxidase 6 [Tanacetum cinerariifolium]
MLPPLRRRVETALKQLMKRDNGIQALFVEDLKMSGFDKEIATAKTTVMISASVPSLMFQSDVQQENREDDDIGGKGEAAPNMLTTLMKTSRIHGSIPLLINQLFHKNSLVTNDIVEVADLTSKDIGSSKRWIGHALEPGNHIYCLYDPKDAEITAYPWDPRVKGLFFHQTTVSIAAVRAGLTKTKMAKRI